MSMMVTCPTCQAMLRVPEGAETIRCPQCKSVLTIPSAVAKPPVPASPPPPVKPAIPLPFARPPARTAPEPEPEPMEAPLPRGKPTRAQAIEESDDDEDEPSEKKKPRSRATTEEAKYQAKLDRMGEQARPARMGIRLLAYGAIAACVAPVGVTLFFFSTLFFSGEGNGMALLPFVGLAFHWILTFIGFICCFFGPKDVRHLALVGAIVVLVHFVTSIGLFSLTNSLIDRSNSGFNGLSTEQGLVGSIFFANLFSNLVAIANLPLIIVLAKGSLPINVYVLILFAAAIEFTKLSLIGMLANHYATEGKDPELGHQSLRFVYRIFWVVIIGFAGQGVILGVSHLGFGFIFLSLPALMIINAYHMWCIFAWVAEFQVLLSVIEVITPARFLDRRPRLETYY